MPTPRPPENPRIELPNGDTIPLTPVYQHQDQQGTHHWALIATNTHDTNRITNLSRRNENANIRLDALPPRTSCHLNLTD